MPRMAQTEVNMDREAWGGREGLSSFSACAPGAGML